MKERVACLEISVLTYACMLCMHVCSFFYSLLMNPSIVALIPCLDTVLSQVWHWTGLGLCHRHELSHVTASYPQGVTDHSYVIKRWSSCPCLPSGSVVVPTTREVQINPCSFQEGHLAESFYRIIHADGAAVATKQGAAKPHNPLFILAQNNVQHHTL